MPAANADRNVPRLRLAAMIDACSAVIRLPQRGIPTRHPDRRADDERPAACSLRHVHQIAQLDRRALQFSGSCRAALLITVARTAKATLICTAAASHAARP